MVSFDPEAVTICCSLVPENCPRTAEVIDDGGCIVKLYMNIELVVAMVSELWTSPRAAVDGGLLELTGCRCNHCAL